MKIKDISLVNPKSNRFKDFINYIDTSSVLDGTISNVQRIENDYPSRAQRELNVNDILISSVRPNLRHNCFIKKPIEHGIASTGFIQIRVNNDKWLSSFIYYFLTTNKMIEHYTNIANSSTTTFPAFNKEVIEQIGLPQISLEEQRHIVDTIGSVDDLIEKNEEIINKCEEFARAIFIEMTRKIQVFVPFGNVLSRCSTGLNPRKNFTLGHGNCFYVTIKNMSGTNVLLDSKCDKIDFDAIAKISARSHLSKGDVLFSGIGTIGRSYLCYETPTNWNISESVFCFSPNELVSSEYLYELVTSNDFISFANSNASGAAQKGIRMSDLKTHLVPLLNKSDLEKFNSKVKPILKKANICRQENDKLSRNKRNLLEKYFASD